MKVDSVEVKLIMIISDPLSYIHNERLKIHDRYISDSVSRSAANAFLIEFYRLSCAEVMIVPHVSFWVKHWDMLREIVYLSGCIVNKDMLVRTGEVFRLPEWAKKFVLTTAVSCEQKKRDKRVGNIKSSILYDGYAVIKEYIDMLPSPLKQRFLLLFDPAIENVKNKPRLNISLVRMVSCYVKENRCKL